MSKSLMRRVGVLGMGVVLMWCSGLSGCGPEESDSMRQAQDQRDQQNMQRKEMLRDARKSVRDQLRELGVKTR